eukprot:scaffold42552_cov86-Phaeocystis_antarctica.AAC.2
MEQSATTPPTGRAMPSVSTQVEPFRGSSPPGVTLEPRRVLSPDSAGTSVEYTASFHDTDHSFNYSPTPHLRS